jgi:hypothetical protein
MSPSHTVCADNDKIQFGSDVLEVRLVTDLVVKLEAEIFVLLDDLYLEIVG